jgi:hypothetical protein
VMLAATQANVLSKSNGSGVSAVPA